VTVPRRTVTSEVRGDTGDFVTAMRQAPDIIVVGEMGD